jgi:hypothetical protein
VRPHPASIPHRHQSVKLTLPTAEAGDSRFSDAANATSPQRLCPSRSLFFAAL